MGADGTLLVLWDISMVSTTLMVLALGGAALCAAVPALLHRTQPAWQGWLGLLVAVLAVAALPTMVSDSESAASLAVLVTPAFILWVIVSRVGLIRR